MGVKKLPDFLVVGAARAGTTALYGYLRQHPQIFMPASKEPNFFAYEGETLACKGPGADFINNSTTDLAAYHALFADAPAQAICGEASPLYLYEPRAPERIHHHVPDARLVMILRNPIEQAYSHFLYATKQAIEPEPDFVEALNAEEQRLADGWQPLFGYSRFPRYGDQLERYLKFFPKEQIFIRTYEEFRSSQESLLRDLFSFIGVDPDFVPDTSSKPNAGGVPKNRALQNFLMRPNPVTKAIGLVVPKDLRWAIRDRIASVNSARTAAMPDQARAILKERLQDDIRHLERLIDRDLGAWLD